MLCLRVILIAVWNCTHMFARTRCSLLASTQVVAKANRISLRCPGVHSFQLLRDGVALFPFARTLWSSLLEFLWRRIPFASRCRWTLGVLVLFVDALRRTLTGGHRQHEIRHRHICLHLLQVGVQRSNRTHGRCERPSEQLAHSDKGLPVRPQ